MFEISVRSKYPEIFSLFINSLSNLYFEYIKDNISKINIYVDYGEHSEKDELRYMCYHDIINHDSVHFRNYNIVRVGVQNRSYIYQTMLWESVKDKEKVISFDDDIIWNKRGFFKYVLNEIPDGKVFGYRNDYFNKTLKPGLGSYCFGTNGIKFKNSDFISDDWDAISEHQGIDTFRLSYLYDVFFLDEIDTLYKNEPEVMSRSSYFIHTTESSVVLEDSEYYKEYIKY